MAQEDLIPLNRRTKEQQKKIQSMGGKANKGNPNSILAAKLREMKKRAKLTDTDMQWFIETIENPKNNVIDMLKRLEEMQHLMEPKEYLALRNQLHKTHFGEKHKIESVNVNIDMPLKKEEAEELLDLLNANRD